MVEEHYQCYPSRIVLIETANITIPVELAVSN